MLGGECLEPTWGAVLAQRLASVSVDGSGKAREQQRAAAAGNPSLVPSVGGKKAGKKVLLLSTDQRRH